MSTASDACEPVSAAGELYEVPAGLAHAFASVQGIKEPQNFSRAMDPAVASHHFVEHWQGLYHLRWLEKLGADGNAVEWNLVWGQPKHTMKELYLSVKGRWPELPAWEFFRQAISDNSKRSSRGFASCC